MRHLLVVALVALVQPSQCVPPPSAPPPPQLPPDLIPIATQLDQAAKMTPGLFKRVPAAEFPRQYLRHDPSILTRLSNVDARNGWFCFALDGLDIFLAGLQNAWRGVSASATSAIFLETLRAIEYWRDQRCRGPGGRASDQEWKRILRTLQSAGPMQRAMFCNALGCAWSREEVPTPEQAALGVLIMIVAATPGQIDDAITLPELLRRITGSVGRVPTPVLP